jgi:hypothetical protein
MNNVSEAPPAAVATPENIGHPTTEFSIEIGARLLEQFSGLLYSSPQKAFEELISNGWDAGATCVDVRIPSDLSRADATMTVLDNGSSMDEAGLRQLWHIAFSPKRDVPIQNGRKIIGKFGIGKLATYVLANRLTYICKAKDGKVRRVTMDFAKLDAEHRANPGHLLRQTQLQVFETSVAEVATALASVQDGSVVLDLISRGIPSPVAQKSEDEFGAEPTTLEKPSSETWTLVVLAGLKQTGRELKLGILRRMLEAALPFGSEMAMCLNGELLASSKIDAPVQQQWVIGRDFRPDFVEIEDEPSDAPKRAPGKPEKPNVVKIPVTSKLTPVPHVDIPGIGFITGRIWLFENEISGGKSEDRGASNGFHVNVLGRVVNQHDPSFGERNLSHASWARFRMAVRADGLNEYLATDREKFLERQPLKIFRAFLRRAFNDARNAFDSDKAVAMPDGGDVLVKSLGVLSLNPLRNVVSETLAHQAPLPGLFDETGIKDRQEKRKEWREKTAENIGNALGEVKYEKLKDDSFVKFRIADSTIIVNKEHPFVAEHSGSRAERELLRTMAMVNLLSDMYALDIGVGAEPLELIRNYRDMLMRYRALQSRRSGTLIAKLLLKTQNDSSESKRLEAAVTDAIRYLGFEVEPLGTPGEPEGIARAFAVPAVSSPTAQAPRQPLYTFTYDAKSSKHDVAATGNINHAGMVEHRERYKANHALVIAPGFSDGALATRCKQQKIAPMTARDLGRLLEYTVEFGAIPVTKLREVLQIYDPKEVEVWVTNLQQWIKEKRPLTIDIFVRALEHLRGKVPDALPAGTISFICRETLGALSVKDADVVALATGLSILVPDLIGVENDKIVVNASPNHVADAIRKQLEALHSTAPTNESAA